MARRTFLWITAASWLAFGLASAASALPTLTGGSYGTWTFYTPYTPAAPTPWERLVAITDTALMLLLPLAATSLAAYLVLLDRDVRRTSASRGFDVRPPPATDG